MNYEVFFIFLFSSIKVIVFYSGYSFYSEIAIVKTIPLTFNIDYYGSSPRMYTPQLSCTHLYFFIFFKNIDQNKIAQLTPYPQGDNRAPFLLKDPRSCCCHLSQPVRLAFLNNLIDPSPSNWSQPLLQISSHAQWEEDPHPLQRGSQGIFRQAVTVTGPPFLKRTYFAFSR